MKKQHLLTLALLAVFTVLLAARLHLAFVRYVDADEFAHLHWSYLLLRGFLPYRDFFMNFTPLYAWSLIPSAMIQSSVGVIMARLLQFAVYASLTTLIFGTATRITKRVHTGLMSAIVFMSFPVLFDKTLELRPDTLMTLLLLVVLYMLIGKKQQTRTALMYVGIMLGLSFLMLQKAVFVFPAVIYLLLTLPNKKTTVRYTGIGLMIPVLLLLAYLSRFNLISESYETIINGSVWLKAGEGAFSPWLLFSPFPLIYLDRGGITIPWVVSTILWLMTPIGIVLLYTIHKRAGTACALYLACGFLMLFIFPTPFVQYLIPLAAISSIACGIAFNALFLRSNPVKMTIAGILSICLIASFYLQYEQRRVNTNAEQLGVIDDILAISRPDESVYDMVGSYVYRPDGYYICCNIYSTFAHNLAKKLPPLRQSLIDTRTKFIVLDRGGKVFWLANPDDLAFILQSYTPSRYSKIYTLGSRFRCQNGTCLQRDVHGNILSDSPAVSFEIVIGETYRVKTLPPGASAAIMGKSIQDDTLHLSPGNYSFTASEHVTDLTIELAR